MKILILNGHPYQPSFSDEIAAKYAQGAKAAGHEVKRTNIRDLKFDLVLRYGYHKRMELEPDLAAQQELIKWCEHLVVVTPVWWGSMPALLKGYFDRVLLPRFAFKFHRGGKWDRLLAGRSARVIFTQGSPSILVRIFMCDCFWKTIRTGILEFCGFKPVKKLAFGRADQAGEDRKAKFLERVYEIGKQGK